MSNIALGINIGHDQGAAIVKDGYLLAAIAQERIDRIKHSASSQLPYQAIDAVLSFCGLNIRDVNTVGFSSTAVQIENISDYVADALKHHYQLPTVHVFPVSHHQAHAESAYFTSGFSDAVALVADGGGEMIASREEAESIFICSDGQVLLEERRLQSNYFHGFHRPHNYLYPFMSEDQLADQISLGKKYEQITNLLGLGINGAGKTMGLAAYGTSLIDTSARSVRAPFHFDLHGRDIIENYYALYKRSGENYFEFLKKHRADIAKSVQDYTENQVLEIVRYIVENYMPSNLCLSGGLFLNCPINHKIIEKHPNINIHICPAAGDDGQAMGAAFAAYRAAFTTIMSSSKPLPYLGMSYTDKEIEEALCRRHLPYHRCNTADTVKLMAKEVFSGKIVGLLHGRSEIGPRALCHRSILANPTDPNMKDHINAKVKHREPFRPFAPVVIAEKQFTYFDLLRESPYMLLAAQVRPEYISLLPAITHVDETARVQAVRQEEDPFVHQLLLEFELLSGVPILLNTSFNDCGEPIVETPDDAIRTFLTTEIDILVMENFVVFKDELQTN